MLHKVRYAVGLALLFGVAVAATPRSVSSGSIDGEATIVGTVRSDAGAALNSASVFIEGMSIGTLTKRDGSYSFIVPAARVHGQRVTVTARLIGYRSSSRQIVLRAGRDTLSFALAANPMRLGEVVVTGEGTSVTREQFGSTVNTVDAPVAQSGSAGYATIRGLRAAAAPVAADVRDADELLITATDRAAPASPAVTMMKSARAEVRRKDAGLGPIPTSGTLRARGPDGELLGDFPLRHTDVNAEISGALARTVVDQRYQNPYTQVIEAVYVFPLPAMAAVNDFVMEVGGRKIVGIVRSRAEAERIYQEALLRGQTASLLTQERPNIFTQSVANIEPGASVDIRITYFEKLAYEHGEYEYVFPMVVGPRYIPKGQQPDATLASEGGKRPPEIVPDAERITPPVLKPGHRSGHDISLAVTLDAGLPIVAEHAVAHQVEIERPSETKHLLRLASANEIPNRDFVLRWKVAGAETQFGVLSHRDRDGGYLSLTMQPPLEPRDEQVTPREITFIMDVSGSMMGTPIAMSKELVRRTLDGLRPEDAFNIVYFSGTNAQLWEEPHPRTPENVAAAKRFLENLSAGGGTEMLAGVERALHAAHDPKYLQMFVFLTDGYVGDEPRILSTIKTERGSARFFGFGIGSSVNRYLIDGIGQEGGGQSFVVIPRDSAYADRATAQLFAAIDSPVLVDVAIDWNGLPVTDAFPAKPRDLFAGQTIDVIARYDGPAHGTIYVTGRVGTRRVRYPVKVDLPEREPSHDALAPMWARAKIADLSSEMLAAGPERRSAIEQEITDLAVEHRLVSQYTAFVAVDESRIVGDGHPVRILQPVELPESVSWKGIFGESPVGVPVRIGAWGLDVQGTESGRVRVGDVDASSAAGRAGIRRGAVVRSVNGAPVSDVGQLERVLMQSGKSVTVELEPGGKAVLPSP